MKARKVRQVRTGNTAHLHELPLRLGVIEKSRPLVVGPVCKHDSLRLVRMKLQHRVA
eukprot:CAMPEP_0197931470 /NCGR_PEP_ID=MMETSP1439-20131203/107133_1 /TAXON_ID=66791 /ORGANISM="Gonyaulax spinifera, Strain CCMP409" /LENGTH=56 /DNA_ID=CAMNT_0043554207 /DNA_START=174 /DNA_END=340 /DNA_ORIENTATION=+